MKLGFPSQRAMSLTRPLLGFFRYFSYISFKSQCIFITPWLSPLLRSKREEEGWFLHCQTRVSNWKVFLAVQVPRHRGITESEAVSEPWPPSKIKTAGTDLMTISIRFHLLFPLKYCTDLSFLLRITAAYPTVKRFPWASLCLPGMERDTAQEEPLPLWRSEHQKPGRNTRYFRVETKQYVTEAEIEVLFLFSPGFRHLYRHNGPSACTRCRAAGDRTRARAGRRCRWCPICFLSNERKYFTLWNVCKNQPSKFFHAIIN